MARQPLFAIATLIVCLAVGAAAFADDKTDTAKIIEELKKTVAEQQKLINELQQRVAALEGRAETKPAETSEGTPQEPMTEAPPTAGSRGAAFMPDFAVIGNHRGTFLVPRGYEGRNRFALGEIEIAMQQPIYAGMNFYATLAGGSDAGFGLSAEEGYVTLSRPLKLPFDGVIGKRRIQFGKLNALHPHQWRFVDAPAAVSAFLGEEGLFGNGASVNYTLPMKNLFANLEVGFWGPASAHVHHHAGEGDAEPEVGAGIASDMATARLWLSRAVGSSGELELGASHAWGKSDEGDPVRLGGADINYRFYPSTYSRLQLQGELFWHRKKERAVSAWHTRSGHYLFLSYAPDKYYEYGLRFDNTRYPWPLEGREQSFSFVWTNRLSEATLLRLQYKVGDRTSDVLLPARRGFSEVFLQFIWGAGSHTHPLQ